MDVGALAALGAAGLAVGFVSGLVGIGGGVLIVPFLYFFYGQPVWSGFRVPAAIETTVAHATSLAVILPTAILGVATYMRSGLVAWRAAIPLAIGSLAGGVAGARVAVLLPGELLRLGFGLFLIATAVQLVWPQKEPPPAPLRTSPGLLAVVGVGIGIFSAVLGVGGGLVAIPMLLYLVRLDLRRIAATSLAIVVFAAAAGGATYALASPGAEGLPPGSVGYVHIAIAVPMAIGAMAAAPLGARANQRIGTRALRRIFAALFLILGVRLVWGVIAAAG